MTTSPWYIDFFGHDYLRIYRPFLTPERTEREVEALVKLLALPPGSKILDLCCGHGRHAIPLAQRGYEVTGLDLSEVFLQKAREDAAAQGVSVRWVRSDMREIPFQDEFDAVINMFSAFGYLEDEGEDLKVLRQVRRALKPGGLFLMEIVHREALIRRFESRSWHYGEDGILVLEERCFNLLTGRNQVEVTLIHPNGRRKVYYHAMRIYSLTELARLLQEAGLTVEATYGGLEGGELTLDSQRLVILARKMGVKGSAEGSPHPLSRRTDGVRS